MGTQKRILVSDTVRVLELGASDREQRGCEANGRAKVKAQGFIVV
jgi:hypothetical protein